MPPDRLYVCTTCERGRPLAPDEASGGAALADAVERALAAERGGVAGVGLRRVQCLNGCLNPCTVALRGAGKVSLRFSRLGAGDAQAVAAFATLYRRSADGRVPGAQWPAALRGRLTVRTPPPG